MRLAKRTLSIKPSATLAITAKAKALKAEGVDIVGFGAGEPDFDTPENIKEAAIKALRDGFTKYTPVGGISELKDAVVEKFSRDNGLTYSPEQVLVSCGAKHSLYLIAQALFEPGDDVLIVSPYWVSYPDQVLLSEANPVIVETDKHENFTLTPELLKKYITPRTKALIVNSPSNPTGLGFSKDVLTTIYEMAEKHDFYLISDEVYEKLIYDDFVHVSIASLAPDALTRTIVVNGLSKSHSMTGWRIGFAAGPQDIIKAMTNIQSQSTSNPTSIAQKAAVEALRGPKDFIHTMVTEFDKRRNYMVERLNAIPGVNCPRPVGAFYTFPDISAYFGKSSGQMTINSSFDMTSYLLEEAQVAVVPGGAFGSDYHIRLSYAIDNETITKGLDRIEESLRKLA
jgi:aspartate aminotransferase